MQHVHEAGGDEEKIPADVPSHCGGVSPLCRQGQGAVTGESDEKKKRGPHKTSKSKREAVKKKFEEKLREATGAKEPGTALVAIPVERFGAGRPSEFEPEWMCDAVIEIGRNGGSNAEMMLAIGVSKQTFHVWQKDHPEFGEAVEKARLLSQVWWESSGRIATFMPETVNATMYIFQMKNRFKEDWNDTRRTELSGPEGGPVPVGRMIDPATLSPEQLDQLEQILLAAKAAQEEEPQE